MIWAAIKVYGVYEIMIFEGSKNLVDIVSFLKNTYCPFRAKRMGRRLLVSFRKIMHPYSPIHRRFRRSLTIILVRYHG